MKLRFSATLLLCSALLLGLLSGCFAPDPQPTEAPVQTLPPETEAPLSGIDAILAEMTLRQKVGQLFIVRPDALESDPQAGDGVTGLTASMADSLEQYPVGGVVMFSQNITSPQQITGFNEALQNASDIPLFISIDEEGGLVARLARNDAFDLPQYESAAAVGADADTAQALEMGSTIGSYLKNYGFNMDFAPVADVNTNPDNPVIGTRAFSSDPEIAAAMAGAAAEGLRQQGIIPVFKHFPGHGDTAEDSHIGIAVSYKTVEEMSQCEWLPFQAAGELDCIMVGHIAVPEITGDMTPATLSSLIVTGILRQHLAFQGLIITDAMEMGAITESYSSGEAALQALRAGCDILLMPDDLQEAFDAVVTAVEEGQLSQGWLDETVGKILRFKQAHGILVAD